MVLLEKCRDDIRNEKTLNYHLYMSLKKALFKPAAFYKGILLPLAQSQTCTLREATIIGSVIAKISIPGIHSAAALLKLVQLPYSGSTSLFIRVLLNKKYALPRRVLDALLDHFCSAETDSRQRPVVWHQALLVFVQRYKNDLDPTARLKLKSLMRTHGHPSISLEVKRELSMDDDNDIPL
jgi:essential nuclear protein 1